MKTLSLYMLNYFFFITAIAGFAVIWRNWINDHTLWKSFIQEHLGVIGHALLCGSCFTYWISLICILFYNPVPHMFMMPVFVEHLFSWMSVSYGAVLLRFFYVMIQETVHYQVHILREDHHH